MKPLYKLFLAAFAFPVFSLALSSCKPKEQPQPDAEYFNCEINGKYWTYRANRLAFNPCSGVGAGTSGMTSWIISGLDCIGPPQTQIIIYLSGGNSFPDRDTFELSEQHFAGVNNPDNSFNSYYRTNDTATGKLIFTMRDSTRVEGQFYFRAYNPYQNKTIDITNGKFSIKL